jgi:hypothetical protein
MLVMCGGPLLIFSGESGSPVLQADDDVCIGVHVRGGMPNRASVIGPLGNVFSHFIEALARKKEGTETSLYPLPIGFRKPDTGFMAITIDD